MHHPIFDEIPGHTGPTPVDTIRDYVGALFPRQWNALGSSEAVAAFQMPPPQLNEELFEWIDILEAARDARRQFVALDLGAGYGRSGIRAALAARQRGINDIRLAFAEGLPKHAAWLREALKVHDLTAVSTVYEKAIAYTGKPVQFMAEHEQSGEAWFGQAIAFPGATDRGYRTITVEPITLEKIAAPFGRIDLIDMDLQGAERELVANSMPTLNAKVKRVHIGTHGRDIEAELRTAFKANGWRPVWDFACHQTNQTPFASIEFVDGVQSWINPRIE